MTAQNAIYEEVSALLIKLFEIDRRQFNLKRACTRIWSWIASTQST
jgi:hypothetical protein